MSETETLPQALTEAAKARLTQMVKNIERLEDERAGIVDDIREAFAEAKGAGYDVKALRAVIALRKQDRKERAEREAILDLYLHALGEI